MELGSVHEFLRGKTILVTGATGFLAKIFVEKTLRVQPDIKKLYLPLRASNAYLATQRLHNEVFGKDLFRVLRDKRGADFGSFISEKVVAVAGDVSLDKLGLQDEKQIEEMLEEINIIAHIAATTKFDERFDIAMGTNTMGALNVLNFAKKCRNLEILLHVSTAYVCGKAEGLITEEPLHMGQTPNRSSRLDINLEKQLIEEKLTELRAQNANEATITSIMKKYGIIRTIDYLIASYGKGTITSFVGHPETILDAIPADMVINSMLIALVAHSNNLFKNWIYHIGSSLRNPFKFSDLQDIMYHYFTNNPWVDRYGKPVLVTKKLKLFSTSMDEFPRNKGSQLEKIRDLYRPFLIFEGMYVHHHMLHIQSRVYVRFNI